MIASATPTNTFTNTPASAFIYYIFPMVFVMEVLFCFVQPISPWCTGAHHFHLPKDIMTAIFPSLSHIKTFPSGLPWWHSG